MELTTVEERRIARRRAGLGARDCAPVRVVPGRLAPRVVGECAHYQTRGGARVWHPSAYARKGWSSLVYCCATRRVEVGAAWLDRHAR